MKSASVLIIDNGLFVLFRDKKSKSYTDCGGSIEKNEKPYEAASRELYEETCKTIYVKPKDIKKLNSIVIDDHQTYILYKSFDMDKFYANLEKNKKDVYQEKDHVIKVKRMDIVKLKYSENMKIIEEIIRIKF